MPFRLKFQKDVFGVFRKAWEKMRDYLLEICCGSAEDAIQAAAGGAERAELCSNLFQGGLTPTLGSFYAVRDRADIKINVMIRPREGGFCYTESEMSAAMQTGWSAVF